MLCDQWHQCLTSIVYTGLAVRSDFDFDFDFDYIITIIIIKVPFTLPSHQSSVVTWTDFFSWHRSRSTYVVFSESPTPQDYTLRSTMSSYPKSV